jgi:hypothetical protein
MACPLFFNSMTSILTDATAYLMNEGGRIAACDGGSTFSRDSASRLSLRSSQGKFFNVPLTNHNQCFVWNLGIFILTVRGEDCSISLLDRTIHTLWMFRSARSCSKLIDAIRRRYMVAFIS